MTVRWMAAVAVLLGLAGCMDPHYPLWNPDEATKAGPSGQPLANPGQPQSNPTLDYGTRQWQGGQPTTYQQTPRSPAADPDVGNPVLAPADPNNPYTASGGGYTRQGTTIIGPHGETHSIVGSTVFGPSGRPCSVVGSSLFCN